MNQRPLSIQFRAQYKVDLQNPTSLPDDLGGLYRLRECLRRLNPKLAEWFLGGNSKEQAFLYEAFDDSGPTTALIAVLKEKNRQRPSPPVTRPVGLWNGEVGPEGATMGMLYSQTTQPSLVDFQTRIRDFLSYDNALIATRKMVEVWSPLFVSVEPVFYHPVFKDRPGVGWMLYLPRVLTTQQVPEARALVPVMTEGDGKKQKSVQLGTIIVSVTDEPFSDENPEHVKIANAIEIRLVDQDLLPRYADL
jgi:Immunity protein 52